jgi:cytochrome P450 family 110
MQLPSGPKTPRLLQNIQFVTDPLAYMEAAQERYGDIFSTLAFSFHSQPTLIVSNPEALKQILTNDTKDFNAPSDLNQIMIPWMGSSSVLVIDGEPHRRQRRLLMPPFHGERLRSYGQTICDITAKVMEQQTMGEIFSARSTMLDVSIKIMMEVLFGSHDAERCEQIIYLMLTLMKDFENPLLLASGFLPFLQRDLGSWSPWGYFVRMRQQIDDLIYAEIDERRQKPDPERADVLSLLLSARDEAGEPMTNQELRDQLISILFVGHENTSTGMAWALYWVHKQPEVCHKLLAELESLGESPDAMSIARLPYLTAVCNETLRMSSVNILLSGRMVRTPLELMGYKLSPGTAIFGSIYLTHRREDLYPEPKQFKPERFLERQFSPYEFLPFGGGNRSCIGANLAVLKIKLALATILSRYKLALADNRPERLQGRGVVLVPANGVKMVIQSQRTSQDRAINAVAVVN